MQYENLSLRKAVFGGALAFVCAALSAAPTTYEVDPNHTFPSFDADHMGGLSRWRGKIKSTAGSITLDKQAQRGSVELTMDVRTIDFGHEALNEHARTPDLFDTGKYPTATYEGDLIAWQNGIPTAVSGMLTLHGVTRPVRLEIESFKCMPHPQLGVEVCGAGAVARIDRADFGIDFGKNFGFDMGVNLNIQVEALALE